jgi:hypothetical protein
MKVEWLNDERTRARITRGWFRKRCAEVYRHNGDIRWYFVVTDAFVGNALDYAMDVARMNSAWEQVVALPKAIATERKA